MQRRAGSASQNLPYIVQQCYCKRARPRRLDVMLPWNVLDFLDSASSLFVNWPLSRDVGVGVLPSGVEGGVPASTFLLAATVALLALPGLSALLAVVFRGDSRQLRETASSLRERVLDAAKDVRHLPAYVAAGTAWARAELQRTPQAARDAVRDASVYELLEEVTSLPRKAHETAEELRERVVGSSGPAAMLKVLADDLGGVRDIKCMQRVVFVCVQLEVNSILLCGQSTYGGTN